MGSAHQLWVLRNVSLELLGCYCVSKRVDFDHLMWILQKKTSKHNWSSQGILGWDWGGTLKGYGLIAWCDEPYAILYDYACGPKNRSRKTHVFEYRDCGVGWGGVGWGGHVNVPCTSYMIYCHAAKISGIIYYVTCCYAAEISGIVDYFTYMLLRCWDLWDRVLRYIHVATLLRSLVSFTTLHTCCYAAEISGIVYYVTCCYAAEISEISESLAMEMHSQECWLPAVYYACVAAMTLKNEKTRPKFFQHFQSSN